MKYSPRFIARIVCVSGPLLVAPVAMACMWIHGTTLDGKFVRREGHDLPDIRANMEAKPAEERSLFQQHVYHPADPVASANDAAVLVLIGGDAEKAVKMLEDIEEKTPGVYFTAANRGTALELAGRDEEALKWILEGIRRNPDSHMKTEWLHARILETKIQMKTQPEWLKTHTITGLDLTRLDDPELTIHTAQGAKFRIEVYHALLRQLSVRVLFVKPVDPIVAQLLIELGYLESREGLLEYAQDYFDLAVTYGADVQWIAAFRVEIEEKIRTAARPLKHMSPMGVLRWIAPVLVVSVLLAGSVFLILFFNWKKRRRLAPVA